VNICVHGNRPEELRPLEAHAEHLYEKYRPSFFFASTFDLSRRDAPDYAQQVIAWMDQTIDAGAVMVKLWKEVGMEITTPTGEYVMPDDPVFDPIYSHLAARRVPLLVHVADPLDAWRPLDPASVHYQYYSKNPEWHLYGRDDFPSHSQIIEARDRVLEKHPDLIVVGAHLGSMEHDVDEVAKRFDRYPNFYVDVSARKSDLARQPSEKVRDFFIRYQDRILYGVDLSPCQFPQPGPIPDEKRDDFIKSVERTYWSDYEYFAGAGTVKFGDRDVECLALPRVVLEKFYHGNAQRLMPALTP
jgi:predicted TIM-barrel fold metal-dependent hydrolase